MDPLIQAKLAHTSKLCEATFQNGGSKHQVRTADGVLMYDAAPTLKAAKAYAIPGQFIWSRKKARGETRYSWSRALVAGGGNA